jgi:hypothetical protein
VHIRGRNGLLYLALGGRGARPPAELVRSCREELRYRPRHSAPHRDTLVNIEEIQL